MGLADDREMLEACKADAAQLERDLALAHADLDREQTERLRLQRELDAAETLIDNQARRLQEQTGVIFQAGEQAGILWRERHDLEQQIDRLRQACRDAEISAPGPDGAFTPVLFADEILALIGAQPAPSGDEHDRHA